MTRFGFLVFGAATILTAGVRVDIDGDAGHVGSRTVLSHGVPGDADGHLSVPRGGNQHEAHWRARRGRSTR